MMPCLCRIGGLPPGVFTSENKCDLVSIFLGGKCNYPKACVLVDLFPSTLKPLGRAVSHRGLCFPPIHHSTYLNVILLMVVHENDAPRKIRNVCTVKSRTFSGLLISDLSAVDASLLPENIPSLGPWDPMLVIFL